MRRKKILISPKLCDRKGDIDKKWFVELSQRNPKTGEIGSVLNYQKSLFPKTPVL